MNKINPKKLQSAARKGLLIEILNHNPPLTPKGQVDWDELFDQRPELPAQLGADTDKGRHSMSVMVAWLRSNGLVPRAGAGTAAISRQSEPPKIGRPPGGRSKRRTLEEIQLMKQIVQQYKRGRSVDYALAFREHPDWGKLLGLDRPNGLHAITQFGQRIKGGQGKDVPPPQTSRNGGPEPAPAPPPRPQVQMCPRCHLVWADAPKDMDPNFLREALQVSIEASTR